MTDAHMKKAIDYEAPAGVPDTRTADEVEKDMNRVREELTDTVNELATRLDPHNLKEEAKTTAAQTFETGKAKAYALVDDAKAGNVTALAVIGGAAAVIAIVILRKIFK